MNEKRDDLDEDSSDLPVGVLSLGDYDVVARLVEEFAAKVADIWHGYTDGDRTQTESNAELDSLSAKYAAIFRGQNPAYEVAPWRQPPVLAGKIVAWVPGIGAAGDPIARYFRFIGLQVLRGCQDVTEGMALEQAGPMLKWTLKDAAEKLSGVQP